MKIYRLFIWKLRVVPNRGSLWVRGRCIGEFGMYRELVAEAERRTQAAGYPKSHWPNLYDWNV